MKLTVLSEARARDGYFSEHGLSFLLEVDNRSVLFDTGASDVYLRNLSLLGRNPEDVDEIVLSHGHWDHGNGLQFISGKALLCHPGAFQKRFRKMGGENIGLRLSRIQVEQQFHLRTSDKPLALSEHLYFLGEVPRLNDFEAKTTKYELEDGSPDFIMDDSGLAYISEKGLVVISGCAHSGICNMVEHARRVTGVKRVEAVVGGFHLKAQNNQSKQTIQFLKQMDVQRVCPSHCTMDAALVSFHRAFGKNEVLAGTSITF